MTRKQALKSYRSYRVEITATVEVITTFIVEAKSEDEARSQAEDNFENGFRCEIEGSDEYDDWSVMSIDSEAELEEVEKELEEQES